MIVSEPREKLWAWINSRTGTPWSEDLRCIGLVAGDCLQAVAAYNAWVGRTCVFQGAIDDPSKITRTFTQAIFEFPFTQCGLTHMFSMVSVQNEKSLKCCQQCGFKEVLRLEGAGPEGEDMLLLLLKREECRWIKRSSNGQEERTTSGSELSADRGLAGSGLDAEHREPDRCESP